MARFMGIRLRGALSDKAKSTLAHAAQGQGISFAPVRIVMGTSLRGSQCGVMKYPRILDPESKSPNAQSSKVYVPLFKQPDIEGAVLRTLENLSKLTATSPFLREHISTITPAQVNPHPI